MWEYDMYQAGKQLRVQPCMSAACCPLQHVSMYGSHSLYPDVSLSRSIYLCVPYSILIAHGRSQLSCLCPVSQYRVCPNDHNSAVCVLCHSIVSIPTTTTQLFMSCVTVSCLTQRSQLSCLCPASQYRVCPNDHNSAVCVLCHSIVSIPTTTTLTSR